MYSWIVEFWKEHNDCSTDFELKVEARNAEEACEIARYQEPCGKHFKAREA